MTSGRALKVLRDLGEKPENLGKILGSSAILSHCMISRMVNYVSDLREMLNSDDYLNDQGKLKRQNYSIFCFVSKFSPTMY